MLHRWLIDWIETNAVSAIFQPCNDGDYVLHVNVISLEILKLPRRPSQAYSSSKYFACQRGCYRLHGAPLNVPFDVHKTLKM